MKKLLGEMTEEEKRAVIRNKGGNTEHLMSILLELQRNSGQNYIDRETVLLVAEELGLSGLKIDETLAFYDMLETRPRGRYILEICNSTPCYYSGAEALVSLLKDELGIGINETTDDGMFSLRFTPCVGACDIGPVIKIGDEVFGNLTPEKVQALLAELRARTVPEKENANI